MRRLLIWAGVDSWRTEVADVDLRPDGLLASGTQIGVDPLPYRLDYTLDATAGFVTKSLVVEIAGEHWSRRLALARDPNGRWRRQASEIGEVDLPVAEGDTAKLDGALDCDLGLSPLTNLMPIRRHELHRQPGSIDLVVAWVSVPDLGLHVAKHRYEHIRRDGEMAVVRFAELPDGFVADLVVDRDGVVVDYPGLARRVPSAMGIQRNGKSG